MNLYFVVPYMPNQVRVRPYQIIRALASKGHSIHLYTLIAGEGEQRDLVEMREVCKKVTALRIPGWRSALNSIAALPGRAPLQSVYSWLPALARQLNTDLQKDRQVDAVHIEHLRGSRYALLAEQVSNRLSPIGPAVVWDSVDSISLLFRQAGQFSTSLKSKLITRFELDRTERFERELSAHFDRILVTSNTDCQAFLKLNPGAQDRLRVIPNGVDVDYFSPNPMIQREQDHLVISGKMSYHANISMVLNFVERVLPRVWLHSPDVRLTIVGKDPHPSIMRLAGDPRIRVTGTVDDLRPYLWRASIAVAPITYGVGIQNKVLEAMACGTPVISTPQAVSALAILPGREAICAEDDESLANAILILLKDPGRQAAMAQAGRDFIETSHRWYQIVSNLEEEYGEAVRGRRIKHFRDHQ